MFNMLIGSYVLLAVALFLSNGHHHPTALLLVIGSFGVLLKSTTRQTKTVKFTKVLLVAIVTLMITGLFRQPIIYPADTWFLALHTVITVTSLILVMTPFALHMNVRRTRTCLVVAMLSMTLLYLLVPTASPEPQIDVFAVMQDGSSHVLQGLNPYSHPPAETLQGRYAERIPAYVYPPANLYLQAPVRLITGDVRYLSILGELTIIGLLWLMTRKKPIQSLLLCLLWIVHPRGLFVVEQSWLEPAILAIFALFIWLQTSRYEWLRSGVYGLFLSLKQSLFFFGPHLLLLEKRPKYLLVVVAVTLITAVPFFLWNSTDLWQHGIVYTLSDDFKGDSLNVASWIFATFSIRFATWATLLSGTIAAVLTPLYLRNREPLERYLLTVCITTFTLLLFGKQAYCNYYYFVGGIMVLLLAQNMRQLAPEK